jgi:uncharacterized membrane protein YfcA
MGGFEVLLLVGAGLAGGVLSGLVGGAAIITFPALLAVGLSPLVATATNLAAMTPPNYLAALADHGRLPRFDLTFSLVVLCSILGALFGAILLLLTPGRLLEMLVPVLLGIATVIFAYSRRISDWVRARAMARHGHVGRADLSSVPIMLPVSIYGGYFGAGAGVMMLAVLSIWSGGDYRTANVTRNLVMSLNSTGAAALFIYQGRVEWKPMAVLMAGALIGSLVGGRIARVARPEIMQVVVIAMGCLLTGVYTWKYWF